MIKSMARPTKIGIYKVKEALDECVAEYHDEDPDFYDGRVKFFEENDQ